MRVRRVLWMDSESKQGRLGLIEWNDAIGIKSLSRRKLPAKMLFGVLDATVSNWKVRAEILHLKRKHGWRVATRVGMSGCTTFILRSEKDSLFLDYPVVARLHVTQSGYVDNFELWLGDLAVLASKLRDHFSQLEFQRDGDIWVARDKDGIWSFRVIEPIEQEFEPAGNPSGLVDGIPEEFWESLE